MNRRSVIRCILGLAAAPKILAELDFKPPASYNLDYMYEFVKNYLNGNQS